MNKQKVKIAVVAVIAGQQRQDEPSVFKSLHSSCPASNFEPVTVATLLDLFFLNK